MVGFFLFIEFILKNNRTLSVKERLSGLLLFLRPPFRREGNVESGGTGLQCGAI
jgi:hypothetical protein